ncbi:MAG TPA: hypothetical protein VH853_05575 [Polyangia bacterium]|jgi:hypothetical protein|nr:hypothetical protein [Polyangia bacterium]
MTVAPRARASSWRRVGAAALAGLAVPLAALAAPLAVGCQRDIRLLPSAGGDGGAAAGHGGAAGVGGAAGSPAACVGLGDPILLPTAGGATCAAALEARGHRFALCACDALSIDGKLRTDAFDSTDSSVSDDVSAAVGVDGALHTTAELRAGGAIYVADAAGVTALDHLQAGASFQSNGPLAMQASSKADLLADADVAGDVSGTVNVTGTLHVPASATVGPDVQASAVVTGAVSVTAPCDCSTGPAGFVDVAGAIAAAAASNGDAAAGFTSEALAAGSASAARLDLGCGAFYLSAVSANAPITLAVHGRALLAVAGSLTLVGGLTVTLDPSAELDLLIGGWLTTSGGTVGAPDAPARFRIWIAGTDPLVFANQPTIAAVVHAPGAAASAPDGLTLSGSLLVGSLALGDGSQSAPQSLLHYDRAILSAGVPCGEPAAAVVP